MKIIIFTLMLLFPTLAFSNCCRAIAEGPYYMSIHNMSNYWVSCYIGHYSFQIPPGQISRAYPNAPWGCR